jgi:hypothetical protein
LRFLIIFLANLIAEPLSVFDSGDYAEVFGKIGGFRLVSGPKAALEAFDGFFHGADLPSQKPATNSLVSAKGRQ